jgi:hypothetical protein
MVVSDPPRDSVEYPISALARRLDKLFGAFDLAGQLPVLTGAGVLLGMSFVIAISPLGSGDYCQWLMTSRAILGESVPAYRDLSAVPPVVPVLIAAVRLIVPDPIAALHVAAVILLLGLGASLYALGTVTGGSRWAGALSIAVGFLVTDRFTDLFAFGGLLQAGALIFAMVSITAFIRAAAEPEVQLRTWWIGVGALALAAVTHVGTSTITVPIGGVAAGLALLARPERDFDAVLRRLRLPLIGLLVIGAFWLFVLRVASQGFIDNPASLAYRGPDRLWELLLARWPTALVLIVGTCAIVIGALRSLMRRRVDGFVALAAWSVVTWSVFAYAIVSGSATDFPRFTTPLLVPVVIGTAAAAGWELRALAGYVRGRGLRPQADLLVPVVVVGLVLGVTPFAIERLGRQAGYYALRDAPALMAAAEWIAESVDEGQSVLADTREAKWIEGLTGLPALFSQSVRYAFRPDEWQRSTDADALLRSSATMTTGLVSAQYTDTAEGGTATAPTDLLLRFNHRGEMVDLLRIAPGATTLTAEGTSITTAALDPQSVSRRTTNAGTQLITRWIDSAQGVLYSRTVIGWQDGSTIRIVQRAPDHQLSTLLSVPRGLTITSMRTEPNIRSAVACFTLIGAAEPCVRVRATQLDARVSLTTGGIAVSTTTSERLDLLVTTLTPGVPAVGLQVLEPAQIADHYDVGAALLNAVDPSYPSRAARLKALGFTEGPAFGPYQVLVRSSSTSP